jgi:hypothetical protein
MERARLKSICRTARQLVPTVAVLLFGARAAIAQPGPAPAPPAPPVVPLDLTEVSTSPDGPKSPGQRVRLFLTPAGGVGDLAVRDFDPSLAPPGADPMDDLRLDLAFNSDNPYFDFRMPGDPGGVGYQRYQTAWQVLDTGDTGLSFNCQAVTPAGLEADGVANGATWLTPGVSWFQRLGEDGGFQAFVSKSVRPQWRGNDNLEGLTRYGFAVHSPCPVLDGATPGRVFLFMEAVGNVCPDELVTPGRSLPRLVVLPGLHLQTGTNCWLSGGVMLPVMTGPRTDPTNTNLWQVTCSWRF